MSKYNQFSRFYRQCWIFFDFYEHFFTMFFCKPRLFLLLMPTWLISSLDTALCLHGRRLHGVRGPWDFFGDLLSPLILLTRRVIHASSIPPLYLRSKMQQVCKTRFAFTQYFCKYFYQIFFLNSGRFLWKFNWSCRPDGVGLFHYQVFVARF